MADRYRNVGGPHRRADGTRVAHGEVFTPTARELRSGAGDKFVPVTSSRAVAGADIGLRSLAWGSQAALKKALDRGLSVEEMQAVGATGAEGFITADVNRALEARDA